MPRDQKLKMKEIGELVANLHKVELFSVFILHLDDILQSNQVKRTPQEPINEFIIRKLNP